jgi:hypothetical protein
VQVVEHQHERPPGGERRQQSADRAVRAVALVGHRAARARAHRRERGEDLGQLLLQLGRELGAESLRGGVRVERVGPDREREVALELRGGAGEHEAAAPLRPPAQLGQQPRLADPRLALDRHAAGHAGRQRVERVVDRREL